MIYVAGAVIIALIIVHTLERRQFTAALELAHSTPSGDLQALIDLTDRLCQRIQAPLAAIAEHHDPGGTVSWPAVTPDDDDAHWAAQEISKEQLAEIALEQELASRGGVPAG